MKKEGYKYIKHLGGKQHLLLDTNTNTMEVWASNKGYAGYTLKFKNTELEFCHSVKGDEVTSLLHDNYLL